jgi:hypothetical protein
MVVSAINKQVTIESLVIRNSLRQSKSEVFISATSLGSLASGDAKANKAEKPAEVHRVVMPSLALFDVALLRCVSDQQYLVDILLSPGPETRSYSWSSLRHEKAQHQTGASGLNPGADFK